MGKRKGKLAAAASRAFAPREFLIRGDGKVKYVTVSTRMQVSAAALALAFGGWVTYSSANLLSTGNSLGAHNNELRQTKAAYESLLREVQESYDQFARLASSLESVVGSENESAETGGTGEEALVQGYVSQRSHLKTGHAALKSKVHSVETGLRELAGQNRRLADGLAQLQERLRRAEDDKLRVADLGAHIGEKLRAVQAELVDARSRNAALANEMRDLQLLSDAELDPDHLLEVRQQKLAAAMDQNIVLEEKLKNITLRLRSQAILEAKLQEAEASLARATEHNAILETDLQNLRERAAADAEVATRLRDAEGDLKQRLQAAEAELAGAADQSGKLEGEVGKLRQQLATADELKRQLVQAEAKMATASNNAVALETDVKSLRELIELNAQAKQRLVAAEAKLASQASTMAALEEKVRSLQQHLALAQDTRVQSTAAQAVLDSRIVELEQQLAAARNSNSRLVQRIEESQQALAAVTGQRDALQTARTDLTNKVGTLEGQLASVAQAQDSVVKKLAQRTRNSVAEVEKTVAMTGLDVNGLLDRADQELSGQGGPFIAVQGQPEPESNIVLASVATLDDEVDRWEKIQFILRNLPLSSPLEYYYVTSRFGQRTDPITRRMGWHEGLDFVSSLKAPVIATAPGRVVYAGWKGSYGRMVEIDHGLGIRTRYAHLAQITVKVGDQVDYRQRVGLLGNSGRSTGPHVHYEVLVDGKAYDPANFLKAGKYVFKG